MVPGIKGAGKKQEDMVPGKREAEVTEVEDCREPPREGGRLMGGNRGNSGGEVEPF